MRSHFLAQVLPPGRTHKHIRNMLCILSLNYFNYAFEPYILAQCRSPLMNYDTYFSRYVAVIVVTRIPNRRYLSMFKMLLAYYYNYQYYYYILCGTAGNYSWRIFYFGFITIVNFWKWLLHKTQDFNFCDMFCSIITYTFRTFLVTYVILTRNKCYILIDYYFDFTIIYIFLCYLY